MAAACQQCARPSGCCVVFYSYRASRRERKKKKLFNKTVMRPNCFLFWLLWSLFPPLRAAVRKEIRDPYQSAEISDECLRKYFPFPFFYFLLFFPEIKKKRRNANQARALGQKSMFCGILKRNGPNDQWSVVIERSCDEYYLAVWSRGMKKNVFFCGKERYVRRWGRTNPIECSSAKSLWNPVRYL